MRRGLTESKCPRTEPTLSRAKGRRHYRPPTLTHYQNTTFIDETSVTCYFRFALDLTWADGFG